jgi:hypothetical protein
MKIKAEWILRFLPIETILHWVGKQLTGADDTVIDYAFQKVEELDKENLPGYQKREKLYAQLKGILNDAADWAINLLIELAVAYIRMKQAKAQK